MASARTVGRIPENGTVELVPRGTVKIAGKGVLAIRKKIQTAPIT